MMNQLKRASSAAVALAQLALWLPAAVAGADQRLLEGFERGGSFTTTGGAALVSGADAVTEGGSALLLQPGASVSVPLALSSAEQSGWLMVDTFESHPTLARVVAELPGGSLTGHVIPGRDTLALPASLAAGHAGQGRPGRRGRLTLRNVGEVPVVVDNLRLEPPPKPPRGAVLLDFGPSDQKLWPGFQSAETQGQAVAWSGRHRICSYAAPFPDPLRSDFAGPNPAVSATETLTIRSPDVGTAWIWLTHYGYHFSPKVKYGARLNGRVLLGRVLRSETMLSGEGLLLGKDQPWTPEWFEQSFLPQVLSRVQAPLRKGANVLELVNCQVAALATAPRASATEMQAYLRRLGVQQGRFLRQFVLATRRRARCDLAPRPDEAKAGVMVFSPPLEEGFDGRYVPQPEHRAETVKLAVAAGSTTLAPLVVVPIADAGTLQAKPSRLTSTRGGTIPASAVRVLALQSMPRVRDGVAYDQPFLPVRQFRRLRSRGVYWLVLRVCPPERTRTGTYRGELRVQVSARGVRIPLEVRVVRIGGEKPRPAPAPIGRCRTRGVYSQAEAFEVYRGLSRALPVARRVQISRTILQRLSEGGLNAHLLAGPALTSNLRILPKTMVNALRARVSVSVPGKTLVKIDTPIRVLRRENVQPGTRRHVQILRDLVRTADSLCARAGLRDYALLCGWAYPARELDSAADVVATVRNLGGRPALVTKASYLLKLPPAKRGALLKNLDTLVCDPDSPNVAVLADEFRKTGAEKTFLLWQNWADPHAWGLYCWSVGADGAFFARTFDSDPLFNAFWFPAGTLLLPTEKWDFQPTLNLLLLEQGWSDCALAADCEALVESAEKAGADAAPLRRVLGRIRRGAGAHPPRFDRERFRPLAAGPEQLARWREQLLSAAEAVLQAQGR